jgi:serine/threonine protein kinase/WD40 repeat protein
MTPSSSSNAGEAILAQFVQELEAAPSREAVIQRYCAAHAELSAEFRALADMIQRADRALAEPTASALDHLGEFRIVRLIARGGMGEIYEAVQARLQRRVAVKVIHPGRTSPLARARFLREQLVLARLHQTHIVPIHTAGELDGMHYFAMPYIEGAALHTLIQATGQLQPAQQGTRTPGLAALARGVTADGGKHSDRTAPARRSAGTLLSTVNHRPEQTPGGPEEQRPGDAGSVALEPNPARRTLSTEYFRSVARVLADAAEALHHAHGAQVLHRDVKPSNLMVDRLEQCWLLDFGLARMVNGRLTAPGDPNADLDDKALTQTGVLGTPHYMAPEQFDGQADVRTDVWGLGVTLYELLTLQRPFGGQTLPHVRAQVETSEPVAPRELVANVPGDLTAICRKAMQKAPDRRYQTAAEFAADLRRWLRWEPVSARRAWAPRRFFLWARRNKGWAAALGLALCALVTSAWAALAERAEADRIRHEERTLYRETLIQQINHLRLTPHRHDWRDRALDLVRQAAEIHTDPELQTVATATLRGLEAHLVKQLDGNATSVAFDPSGKGLLIGGAEKTEARLWNADTDQVQESGLVGPGPVAFRKDGTPVQLGAAPNDPWALILWDVSRRKEIRRFKLPRHGAAAPSLTASFQQMILTPDARYLAVAPAFPDGKDSILVWSDTGDPVREIPMNAQAVALTPDGSLLAAGDNQGHIRVWRLPEGEPLELWQSRAEIHCLAFHRNPLHREGHNPQAASVESWLLASGGSGGTLTIWDLQTKLPRTFCRGLQHEVNVVAFSPDGATVAAGSRGPPLLWDVATGRLLLWCQPPAQEDLTGLAFTADGSKLAVSSHKAFAPSVSTAVLALQDGRGIQTLRGLDNSLPKVCFSGDGH